MSPAVVTTVWDRGPAIELLADCSGVLIMLAGGFLVFRTFRERYLLAWILGWSFYLAYRLATSSFLLFLAAPLALIVTSQVAYVGAIALFVTAIFYYTGGLKFRLALTAAVLAGVSLAVARALWWRHSAVALAAVRGVCLLMAVGGAVQLATFSRGRRQVGPWVLVAMLLLLHLDQDTASPHFQAGMDLVIELLLGVSMLLMVLDDSKQRTDRLAAVNVISGAMAGAQEHGSIVLTALEQLKKLTGARAAWFRILDGNAMVLTRHIGLSEKFIRERSAMDVRSADARIVQQGKPTIVRIAALEEENKRIVREEGFDHILLVPVKGKSSIIGSLALGQARNRSYPPDELDFLTAAGHQVGIAVENLKLLEQIIRSHRQWISTFDSIEDMVLVHDADFRILKLNRAVVKRLGVDISDIVYQQCGQVLPGVGKQWQQCPYCDHTRANFGEAPDPCFGGYSIVSTSSFTEAGASRGTIHVIRDTTERRAAEHRYRLLFEQAQEGVFVSMPEGRIIECNDAFVRMLGYDRREEVLALDVTCDMYLSAAQRESFCAAMNEHGFVRNYEVDLRRKDGSILHALENSFATRDASGKVDRFQGFLLDITEKRQAEDAIRKRNRELHVLNAIAMITAQSFDLDEILNTALRRVVEIFSAHTGAVYLLDNSNTLRRRAGFGHQHPSASAEIALPPDFLHRVRESRMEVVTEETLDEMPDTIRELVSSEGLRRWIWVIMCTNDVAVGVLAIGSRDDGSYRETDRHLMAAIARQLATTIEKVCLYEETSRAYDNLRRTQEQLLQSEKMSAIGQLISGVAHEINNPLTAILGYAQLLDSEPLNERAHDFVSKLFKQAQRTQRLVQNLLSFARQRKPEKKQVDIRRVLDDTLALRDFDFNVRSITVTRDIAPKMQGVIADAHQMEQVFLNIINNAVDAISEQQRGGTLSVRAYQQEGRVCIEFRDSGPGIREPKKVFDPFYTTKGVGQGTGLGLSICYGIVKEHGGDILALNHPEGGALFRIMLPASASAAPDVTLEIPRHVPPLRSRILLVDDEEAVLEFEREALAGAGAQVVAVSSGAQAIERLQEEKFDVMLVDSSMSGACTSIDLYRWVAANLPGAEKNIIFTISDIRDTETGAFVKQGHVPFIVKPFQVADLIAATRSLLGRAERAATATIR